MSRYFHMVSASPIAKSCWLLVVTCVATAATPGRAWAQG